MEAGEFRRRYERKKYGSEVIFSCNGRAYAGTLRDICLGGAFVMTLDVNQLGRGDVVILSIPFTDGRKSVKRKGRVSWTNNEGFAIEFSSGRRT
jgi:Tfp pilus assembly protein PilZ